MTCRSILDHEWDAERIVGSAGHPTLGRVIQVEQRCQHCGRVRRMTRPSRERPVLRATEDVA